MTTEEIIETATIAYKKCNHIPNLRIPKEFIETFAKLIAAKTKQEQGEPVAYMSSTKNNQLVSKNQYDSMEGKNKSHFDIFLYDKPKPKQNQSEPYLFVQGDKND